MPPGKSSIPRRSTSLRRGIFRRTPEQFYRVSPAKRRLLPARFTFPNYFNSDPLDDGPQGQNVNLATTTFDAVTNIGESYYWTPGMGRQAFVAYSGSIADSNGYYRWDLPSAVGTTYMRGYFMFGSGVPNSGLGAFMQVRINTGSVIQAQVRLNSSGEFDIRDGTTPEGTPVAFMPFTVYRLEWTLIAGGLFELKGFSGGLINNASNGTASFTITSPSGLLSTRSWDGVQFGPTSTMAPVSIWMADLAYSTTAMPAPLTYAVNSVASAA